MAAAVAVGSSWWPAALTGPSILPGCRGGDPVDATAATAAGSGTTAATIPTTELPPAHGGTGVPDGAPDHGTGTVLDPAVAPLEWHPNCGGGFECATLEVPWDGGIAAAEPTAPGRSMQLPVIRLPHRGDGLPLGSVVLN
ncbi:MAG: hypothetical protein R2755_02175 [Acidimicrobiales bacterium]